MRILFYYMGTENLGIEYISSYLKEHGHKTELIFDPGFEDNFFFKIKFLKRLDIEKKLIQKAIRFSPDIIAFGGVTNMYGKVDSIAKKLKEKIGVLHVIGGIHAATMSEKLLSTKHFDIACVGEGEEAMLELVNNLEQKKDITNIKSLIVKKGNKLYKNEQRSPIKDLDVLPFPDKDLFYKYGIFKNRIIIMASRGCAFKCSYCVNSMPNIPPLRVRGVENVIKELELYKKKYKAKSIFFEDDLFPFNKEWVKKFSQEYKKRINLPFYCNVHPATVNKENLINMKKAGCVYVSMGIQTASENLRKNIMNRQGSNEQIINAAKMIRKQKIKLNSNLIFGSPRETLEDMYNSMELNYKIRPHSMASFILYPFPGTALEKYCIENNLLRNKKELERGEGSYHTTLFIKHDFPDDVMKFNSLSPLFSKLSKGFYGLFKILERMKYGSLHKVIYLFSIPLVYPIEFYNVLKNYPRLIYCSFREFKR